MIPVPDSAHDPAPQAEFDPACSEKLHQLDHEGRPVVRIR